MAYHPQYPMPANEPFHPMKHFEDHTEQAVSDLEYGQQLTGCERYVTVDTEYRDGGITGDWDPGED